jgi:hypothetical protein
MTACTAAAGGAAPAAVGSRAGEAGEQRGLRGRRRGGKVRGAHLEKKRSRDFPVK